MTNETEKNTQNINHQNYSNVCKKVRYYTLNCLCAF